MVHLFHGITVSFWFWLFQVLVFGDSFFMHIYPSYRCAAAFPNDHHLWYTGAPCHTSLSASHIKVYPCLKDCKLLVYLKKNNPGSHPVGNVGRIQQEVSALARSQSIAPQQCLTKNPLRMPRPPEFTGELTEPGQAAQVWSLQVGSHRAGRLGAPILWGVRGWRWVVC